MAMSTSKISPITAEMQVDEEDQPVDSENDHDTKSELRKKRPNPFKQYYSTRTVEQELGKLRQKVAKLKTDNKVYEKIIRWILKNIGNHSIAETVVIGNDNVIIDNGEGHQEDMKAIMTKHIKKVTCEHASISKDLATMKNIIQMSSMSLQPTSKKSDKKLESVLELLEMTLQSDYGFEIKIDMALVAIQKWSEDSKRTIHDIYKATVDQAPKEALSTIQFVASKCVDDSSREVLQKLLDIVRHAMEFDPTNQNICFRGLILWRRKNPKHHKAKQLQKLLQDLDKITLEEREQVSESVLKLKSADQYMMDGTGEQSLIRMYKNVEETLAHVTSISQKLATTEQREILDIIQPEDSVIDKHRAQPCADHEVHRRARSLSIGTSTPRKAKRKNDD